MIAKMRLAAGICALALAIAPAHGIAKTTLRFIPQADLRSLDPIWTTAYIARSEGCSPLHDHPSPPPGAERE